MSQPDRAPTSEPDAARTAGRGFLLITVGKLWFMVCGAGITLGLPFLLGREGYGRYQDLNNTLSIATMVLLQGGMQSISRFVSQRPDASGGAARQALKLMVVLGGVVAGSFFLLAPQLAAARGNPELVDGYRFAAVIPLCYGLYAVYVGILNGRKEFHRQSLFDIGYATLRASGILGLAALVGVVGVFAGFAAAAVVITALAAWRVGRAIGDGPAEPDLVGFGAKVMLYTLVFNLVYKLDLIMLKPAAAAALGGTLADPAIAAEVDGVAGLYGLAVALSRLPWQLTIAVTFVVFPMLSEATFSEDRGRAVTYIRQTLRYALMLIAAAATVLIALPDALVGLWKPEMAGAARALVWLAPAYVCFSLFNIVNTMLMSAGRPGAAVIVGAGTAAAAAALYATMVPGGADVDALLVRTSIASLIAFAGGLVAGLWVLWRAFGPPVPMASVLRIGLVGGLVIAAGRAADPTGWVATVAVAGGMGLLFLLGLIMVRELGPADRERLTRVVGRRR
jgi:stage V sporulation protein B